jgi:hypothetical protein
MVIGECGGGPPEAPVRAFVWFDDQRGMQPIAAPPATTPVEARSMLISSPAVGMGADGTALVWMQGPASAPTVLPSSGITGATQPFAISNSIQAVVAGVIHGPEQDLPFRWSQASGYTFLPPLTTLESVGSVLATSWDGSVLVGRMARPGDAGGQAFRWTPAGSIGLGWLSTGGTVTPDSTATAYDFEYHEIVAGFSTGGSLAVTAFRWSPMTGMAELGALPGAVESRAWGVAVDPASAVGECTFPDGHHEAFLWDQWLGMLSLRDVLVADGASIPAGWTLDGATAMLGESLIVGNGHDANGVPMAFVARPRLCYANCDMSTTSPLLSVSDFACFINRFAAGEDYANCDHSTTPPVLNVLDFMCFIDKYVAGCSGL